MYREIPSEVMIKRFKTELLKAGRGGAPCPTAKYVQETRVLSVMEGRCRRAGRARVYDVVLSSTNARNYFVSQESYFYSIMATKACTCTVLYIVPGHHCEIFPQGPSIIPQLL